MEHNKLNFIKFSPYKDLFYGFSNRRDGSMNRNLEKKNRKKYFKSLFIDPSQVVIADLVHASNVVRVTQTDAGKTILETDALITNEQGLVLTATGADCYLLYFYDPSINVIGIAHVGWRGLLAGIIENTICQLVKNFNVDTKNILIGISPGIHSCHFEISPADKYRFLKYPENILEKGDGVYIDLVGIIKTILLEQEVLANNIEDANACTFCNHDDYFSFRRDKPKDVQVQVGYIGLGF